MGNIKGFRQNKKPTKGQIQNEYQEQLSGISSQVQFVTQQVMNCMMELRTLKSEQSAMANILRCEECPGPIEEGHQVMIDYLGRLKNEDGEPGELFEGGFGLGYVVEVGSNSLVAGFEEQLVGAVPGDVKTIEVTFPDNYPEHLQSKEAVFSVKVLKVWRNIDPYDVIQTMYLDLKKAEEEAKAESSEE